MKSEKPNGSGEKPGHREKVPYVPFLSTDTKLRKNLLEPTELSCLVITESYSGGRFVKGTVQSFAVVRVIKTKVKVPDDLLKIRGFTYLELRNILGGEERLFSATSDTEEQAYAEVLRQMTLWSEVTPMVICDLTDPASEEMRLMRGISVSDFMA